jgi:formamidopyrimidine-DNA glycosylase
MPELPEVETTRRGIAPALMERCVLQLLVRERRLRWPIPSSLEAALRGRTIKSVGRRAKYILIGFDHGTLIVHLGMSGSLRILDSRTAPLAHDHWDMLLDTGRLLRFHDPRRFGSLHWTAEEPGAHPLLARLAPEPLSARFDGDYLFDATRRRSVAIKQLLMNSTLVVGVGNIYASEALFRAGISPRRAARRLTRTQAGALALAIKAVLSEAIAIGGTTLRDYVNSDGIPGYFRQKLNVYERGGEPCRQCGTPIKQFTQGQRSTYWCRVCQRTRTPTVR